VIPHNVTTVLAAWLLGYCYGAYKSWRRRRRSRRVRRVVYEIGVAVARHDENGMTRKAWVRQIYSRRGLKQPPS